MAVYGISSGACALTSGTTALVLLRSVQGIGAAMVSATSVALIGAHVPRWRLGRAVGWQTGMTYAGLAIGPMIAGYVVQGSGWRTLFLMNVPASGLAITAALSAPGGSRTLPDNASSTPAAVGRFHLGHLSRLAWIAGLVTFMIALGGGRGQIAAVACATVCAALFIWTDRRESGAPAAIQNLSRVRILRGDGRRNGLLPLPARDRFSDAAVPDSGTRVHGSADRNFYGVTERRASDCGSS